MGDQTAPLRLRINAEPDADDEKIADLTAQLHEELLQLDVQHVGVVDDGELPAGAKAGEALVLGGIVVTLVKSVGGLTAIVRSIQAWLVGNAQRSVKLELDGDVLEVTGLSSDDQRRLISAWIERHADH